MLPCLHSFCYQCLLKHFDANKSEFSCPKCEEAFELNGKLASLPQDLHSRYMAEVSECEEKVRNQSSVNCDRCIVSSESIAVKFCCNCSLFLCSWCTKDHSRWQKTHKHELVDVGEKKEEQQEKSLINSIPRKVMSCPLHSDEVLKFYCVTCSCLICRDCMALSHSGHSYDRIEATAEKERESLLQDIQDADSAANKLEDAIANGEKRSQKIKSRQQSVDNEIKEHFRILYEELHHREEALLAKSAEASLTKITALALQMEEMKRIYMEITRVRGRMKEVSDTYAPQKYFQLRKQ